MPRGRNSSSSANSARNVILGPSVRTTIVSEILEVESRYIDSLSDYYYRLRDGICKRVHKVSGQHKRVLIQQRGRKSACP